VGRPAHEDAAGQKYVVGPDGEPVRLPTWN
jgi:hypothetical protein